jgi:hypothetical protein
MKRNTFSAMCLLALTVAACKNDEAERFSPEKLTSCQSLTFKSDSRDSTRLEFDGDMNLVAGYTYSISTAGGSERFAFRYDDNDVFTSVGFEQLQGTHWSETDARLSLNDHGMAGSFTNGSKPTLTFTYDEQFRLIVLAIELGGGGENRYTIDYDEQSNVSQVAWYSSIPNGLGATEGITTYEFSDYDNRQNPFRMMVNAFYLPAFATTYGVIQYNRFPLGMLLSKNNPGMMVETVVGRERADTTRFSYAYDNSNYPARITSEPQRAMFPLTVKFR